MLRRKALLASQVGSQAVELVFHLTGDVDVAMSLTAQREFQHNITHNMTFTTVPVFC